MESVFTPQIQQQVFEGSFDLSETNDVRQKLVFNKNDSIMDTINSKQPVNVYLRIRPKSALELQMKDASCLHRVTERSLLAIAPSPSRLLKTSMRGPLEQSKHFYFTHIYDGGSTQGEIFNECAFPVIEDFFDGQNCLLFSYGVTNSGKTYTISGTAKEPGILPRALDVIFNSVKDHLFTSHCLKPKFFAEATYLTETEQDEDRALKSYLMNEVYSGLHHKSSVDQSCDSTLSLQSNPELQVPSDINITDTSDVSNASKITIEAGSIGASMFENLSVHEDRSIPIDTQQDALSFGIWVSFAEIYNEIIYDLLGDEPVAGKSRPSLKLSDDRHRNPYIKGLREVKVDSTEEALKLLQIGLRHRHIAGTRLNYQSSRSHAVFSIKIVRVAKPKSGRNKPRVTRVNRISIVDLAGSERSKKTGATGERCKEAGSINNSLHVLGRCIEALRHNQRATKRSDELVVPFRDSKLTQLLQTFFVGKGKNAREGRVIMILNVSNNASVFNETAHVLKFSALASKVVPSHHPMVKNVLMASIPELSPMKPPEPDKDNEVETQEEEPREEDNKERQQIEGPCSDCENFKAKLEEFKNEVVKLKLQLWEQETKIRQEVSLEYNKQLVEIENRHEAEMEEHESIMETEMQQRMMLFQNSTKKHYKRKRRRPEDDEEERQEQFREIDNLNSIKRKLERDLREMKEELEMERNKNSSELNDLMTTHSSKITRLNTQLNEITLASQDMKKAIAAKDQELEAQSTTLVQLTAQNEEFKQSFSSLEERTSGRISELESEVMKITEENEQLKNDISIANKHEERLKSLNVTLEQLKADNKELKQTCLSLEERESDRILELEKEVRELMEENGQLKRDMYLDHSRTSEQDESMIVVQLKDTIRQLEENKRTLEEKMRDREAEVVDLKRLEKEYDDEKEELLLQMVSLEAECNSQGRKRNSLEDELQRRTLENEIAVDELQSRVETLSSELDTCRQESVQEKEKITLEMSEKEKLSQDKIRELKEKLTVISQEAHGSTEEGKLLKRIDHLTTELATVQDIMDSKFEKIKQLEELENKQRMELALKNEENKELEKNCESLSRELKEERLESSQRLTECDTRLKALQATLDETTKELEQLKNEQMTELEVKDAVHKELEQKYELLDQELKEGRIASSQREKEHDDRLKDLQATLDEKYEKMEKSLKQQLEATVSENRELKRDNYKEQIEQIELKEALRKNDSLLESLKETKERLTEMERVDQNRENKVEELSEKLQETNKRMKDCEQELETMRNKAKQEQEKVRTVMESRVTVAVDGLTQTTDRMEETIAGKTEDLTRLTRLVQQIKDKQQALSNKQEKELIELSIETDEKIMALELQLQEVKSERDELRDEKVSSKIITPLQELMLDQPKNEDDDVEHIYDSVHSSFIEDKIKDSAAVCSFNETCVSRRLPILERSSQLETTCSDDDFNTPRANARHYHMKEIAEFGKKSGKKLNKAKSKAATTTKKPIKRFGTKKKAYKEIEEVPFEETPTQRYALRSRKNKGNNENAPPSSPLRARLGTPPTLPKFFSQRKAQTTVKKKPTIRKSQISGPLELQPENTTEATAKRKQKIKINAMIEPCDLNDFQY